MSGAPNADLPRQGLLLILGAPGPEAVAGEIEGAIAGPDDLVRLRAGGIPALPRSFERFAEASRTRASGHGAAKEALVAARRAMLDVVVPPTIRYLAIGCTLALFVLALSFVWPERRAIFFPASGGVLALMIVYAVIQSIRSAREQRRLQEQVYDRQDAVEILRAEARRIPALIAAAGLPADPDSIDRVAKEAAAEGWDSDVADPDRPLIVSAEAAGAEASWLEAWSKARLIVIVAEDEAGAPQAAYHHRLVWPKA